MSKLAYIKATRRYAGDPIGFGAIIKGAIGIGGKLLGIGKKAVTAVKAAPPAVKIGMTYAGLEAAQALLRKKGGSSGGASGSWGRKRRGITATELRGFNKVASLLRRVGMVPRATRTRLKRR